MFVPTYEYECPKCPRVFEVRQRIPEPALTTCDRCGGPIHRLLSATPFILKGGGWYVTDYAKTNGNSSPEKGSAKSEGGGESKPSESKSESKSDTTSESKPSTPAPASTSSDSK